MKVDFKKSIEFDKYIDLSSYDEIVGFSENMIIVKKDNKYGVLNELGKTIIHPTFDYISSYKEGLARVRRGNNWGFINKNAVALIPIIYDWVGEFNSGKAPVMKDNKVGVISKSGYFIVKPTYKHIDLICNNLLVVKENEKYGVVDLNNNNVIIKFKYDLIEIKDDLIIAIRTEKKLTDAISIKEIYDNTGKLLHKTELYLEDEDHFYHPKDSDEYKKFVIYKAYGLKKNDKVIIPAYLNDFYYDNHKIIHDKKLVDLKDLSYKFKLEIIFEKENGKESIIKEFDDEQKMADFIKMFKQEIKNAKVNIDKEINDFITEQEKQLIEFKNNKEDETCEILVNYVDSSYEKGNNLSLT